MSSPILSVASGTSNEPYQEVLGSQHFPFLSLPLEIRCQIYRELLISDAEWIRPVQPWVAATMKRFPKQYMINPWPYPVRGSEGNEYTFTTTKLDTEILLVNRQIYTEAREILLRENAILLGIDGRDQSADDDRQALDITKNVRVLALRVEFYEKNARWIDILKQRTNLRTIRIRLMDRDQEITSSWFSNQKGGALALEPLEEIRACAVATVECDIVNWFRRNFQEGENEEAKSTLTRLNKWLGKALVPKMLKPGCPCLKNADGRHVDRVDVGRGGIEGTRDG